MKESEIQKQIQVGISDIAVMVRVPVGQYYSGKYENGIIRNPRPVRVGFKGVSDLIGFRRSDGKFVAIEVKNEKGKPTKEQLNFIRVVSEAGGLAGIARTADEARRIILGDEKE